MGRGEREKNRKGGQEQDGTSLELQIKYVWNILHPSFISANLAQGVFGKYRFDKWNINNLLSFLVAEYIFVINLEKWQKRKSTI